MVKCIRAIAIFHFLGGKVFPGMPSLVPLATGLDYQYCWKDNHPLLSVYHICRLAIVEMWQSPPGQLGLRDLLGPVAERKTVYLGQSSRCNFCRGRFKHVYISRDLHTAFCNSQRLMERDSASLF